MSLVRPRWAPAYYVFMAANSRLIRCGIEAHVASTKLSFGARESCAEQRHRKNRKGGPADTLAVRTNAR